MAHIGCLCGNDVRQNDDETAHRFVSHDLMREHYETTPFFGLPFGDGDKADIWLCDECGRAIFFDDGGAHVSRIMRKADPGEFDQRETDAKEGLFYNEEIFFNAVDDYLTREHEAEGEPDYEFFEAECADGNPLLTPKLMREKVFENPSQEFPRWSRALLSGDFLAVFDGPGGTLGRLWLLSEEDTALVAPRDRFAVARRVLREHDLRHLEPGAPDGAPADEYDGEARCVADAIPAGAGAREAAEIIARVFSESFDEAFTAEECLGAAEDLLERWSEKGL